MKIISELEKIGIAMTDDQKSEITKKFTEEVISNVEHEKKVGNIERERDDAKKDLTAANESIDGLKEKLEGFKSIDVDDLKEQIGNLTKDLEKAKEDAEKAEVTHKLESNVNEFLQDKEFVNDFTKKSIVTSLMEELGKDSARGKSISDIFNNIVNGEDGKPLPNILVDAQLEGSKAKFTQRSTQLPPAGTKLTSAELMKLANENPGLDISQYMTK